MRKGMLTNRQETLVDYVYVVPIMILPTGSVIKHRINGVIMALTDGTDVKAILDVVIRSRGKEKGRYAGVMVSFRTVNTKGHVIYHRTDFAELNEEGDKIEKYHQGKVIDVKRPPTLKTKYEVDVLTDNTPLKHTTPDFVLVDKSIVMDTFAVSMVMDNKAKSYERVTHFLGMHPEQSDIQFSATNPTIKTRTLTLRAKGTNVQYSLTIAGER